MSLVGASCGGRPEFHGGAEWTDPDVRTSTPTHAAFVRPKLIVIRADWCPFCRTAQPAIDAAYAKYKGRVDLVVLDVTDDQTAAVAERVADEEGVAAFFEQYRGRTPTAGVFLAPGEGRRVHGNMEDPETISEELRFAVNEFPLVLARGH
jgi:thiol-disulfide isomerase/thioredoxin